jgi:two-component system response regulator PilR (NtrC family)
MGSERSVMLCRCCSAHPSSPAWRAGSRTIGCVAFPGNIRELENVLERATALSGGAEIGPDDLMLRPVAAEEGGVRPADGALGAPLPEYLDRVEREAILEALARTQFNRTAAAKLLGITFRTLRYRMQRLGITDEHQP